MKHIGLYRPSGFRKNAFMVFYTSSPRMHFETLAKVYEKPDMRDFLEIADLIGHRNSIFLTYTDQKYANHKQVYGYITDKLSLEKSYIFGKIHKNIKPWSFIMLNDEQLQKLDKVHGLDILIDSLLKK